MGNYRRGGQPVARVAFFYHPLHSNLEDSIRRLQDSCRRHDHYLVHIACEDTPDYGLDRLIVPVDPEPLMPAKLHAYAYALHALGDLWLVDPDVQIVNPLPDIDADFMVTHREFGWPTEACVYNAGVLYARPNAAGLLHRMADQIAPQWQAWGGDQVALAEIFQGAASGRLQIADLNALIMPSDKLNYTPESDGEDCSDKIIVHLKGQRKEWEIGVHDL